MNKICINVKNYKLTEGKEYYIVDENDNYYYLVNDNNRTVKYDKSLFTDVQSIEDVQPLPTPLPPPPPARTEQDCINSIITDDNIIKFTDINNTLVEFYTDLSYYNSSISCGVYQLSGIYSFMDHILQRVDTTENDFDLLMKELFIRGIKEKIENGHDCRYVLLSMNREDRFEDFYTHLSSLACSETGWADNPNSGNDIKIWTLDTYEI